MSAAITEFKLRREIARLEEELKQTNSELRLANAELTGLKIRNEDLQRDLDTTDERFEQFEARIKQQLLRQLLRQRKQVSDLKAAQRFEVFDEETGEYKKAT